MKLRFTAIAMFITSAIHGQDMPLSQIIIPGEEWKKVDGTPEPPVKIMPFPAHRPANGFIYSIKPKERAIVVQPANEPEQLKKIKLPMTEPSAWALTRDRGSVLIADAASKYVWMFRLDADGGLAAGEKYITLRVRKNDPRSEASAIRLDNAGRFFVATKFGVQIFDPTGRLCGVLLNPSSQRPTGMTFGGPADDVLYLAFGPELYSRRMQAKQAVYSELKK